MADGKLVVCPGSFDPVTKGHLDIINRASKLFDKVIILVLTNPSKNPSFTKDERINFIKRVTGHLKNVEVDTYSGLLAEYASVKNASAIIKGLRAVTDFESEFQQALTNKKLNSDCETVFLTTSSEYMYLSSSMVKEIASFGGNISDFVPPEILSDIEKRLNRQKK